MQNTKRRVGVSMVGWLLCSVYGLSAFADPPKAQYEHGELVVSLASADEARLASVSVDRAVEYLEKGTRAWTGKHNCVSCHTNGAYLQMRPALTGRLGKPLEEQHVFFVKALDDFKQRYAEKARKLKRGITPTQIAYLASGLAEWDAHVTGQLSAETSDALTLMFGVQAADGSWGNTECWPPFESSNYHGTTVAAMAAATAPGWLDQVSDESVQAGVEKMKEYLRVTEPPHDYGRLLLLWAATRLPDLLDDQKRQQLLATVLDHQQEDGGWSIRSFADPEQWGNGSRAEKLRSEPEFESPPSDGHMTGLAILVAREAGVPADDSRLQSGVQWLQANQRESGRWWTRSLNTDSYHFITYSGTIYALAALDKCGVLK